MTRATGLIGKQVLPAADEPADSRSSPTKLVDPEFGTGAVKVTPAHDPNDFEMGRATTCRPIIVIDKDGR